VRENGGQYTHAAIWTMMALAELGDNRRAWELFTMINPISHSSAPDRIAKYKVEPYVVAADVYAVPPHTGHGGWTWYTGSAGWMYRLIMESLLGLRLEANCLHFKPCIPADWNEFNLRCTIDFERPSTTSRCCRTRLRSLVRRSPSTAYCSTAWRYHLLTIPRSIRSN